MWKETADYNQRHVLFQKQDIVKGELQRENKLISYERVFKMLKNDMYIAGIGHAVLELLSFKFRKILKAKTTTRNN